MVDITRHQNVFIIGPQCTGKTTLVNALAKQYQQTSAPQPTIIREVARNVLETYRFTRDDIRSSRDRCLELQTRILMAQEKAEESSLSGVTSGQWFLSDRSGLDPIVYARLYADSAAAETLLQSESWKGLEARMRAGKVFLCEAGCSWLTDDGTRLMPDDINEWMAVDTAFRVLLYECDIDYTVIPNNVESLTERVGIVLST